jgi:HK97 family phage prohead protease
LDTDDVDTTDVYYVTSSAVGVLTHALHALEKCPSNDALHQAAQVAVRSAILECAICKSDCDSWGGATAAQMVESSRAAVAACLAADEAIDAMTCELCAEDCESGEMALDRVMVLAALNAGDAPPADEQDVVTSAAEAIPGDSDDEMMRAASRKHETRQVTMRVDAKGHEVRTWSVRMGVEDGKIVGYAAVFDQPSLPLDGGFTEVVKRGAFKRAIGEGQDVRALWQHDPNFVLGRTKNGTLEMSEDVHGLRVAISPPDTQWARDAVTSIKRGDVDQMSFTFEARSDNWTSDGSGIRRELLDADLFDVSPVTFPAYPQTSVSARAVKVRGQSHGIAPTMVGNGLATAHMRRRLEIAEKS